MVNKKKQLAADPSSVSLPSTNDLVLKFDLSYATVRRLMKKIWEEDIPRLPRTSVTRIRWIQQESMEDDGIIDEDRIFLLIDQFSSHVNEVVVRSAKALNIELVFVPAGMTSEL